MSAAGCSLPKFYHPAKIRFSSSQVFGRSTNRFRGGFSVLRSLVVNRRSFSRRSASRKKSTRRNRPSAGKPGLDRRHLIDLMAKSDPALGRRDSAAQRHSLATADSTLFGTISRWLGRNSFDRLTSDWKVIAVQGGKSVIVERAFAHGSIVLLADSYPLSNEGLAADRNTGFLLWLIDNRGGVLFDETHLGLSERAGIMTLAQRYGLQGTLVSIVVVLLLFIWKCQYTLVPRTKSEQNGLTVSGCSSDQAFLNLLQRAVSQKDLLGVCFTTWLKTARPTSAQLRDWKNSGSDPGEEKIGRRDDTTRSQLS